VRFDDTAARAELQLCMVRLFPTEHTPALPDGVETTGAPPESPWGTVPDPGTGRANRTDRQDGVQHMRQ